jgi:hypothetical protein
MPEPLSAEQLAEIRERSDKTRIYNASASDRARLLAEVERLRKLTDWHPHSAVGPMKLVKAEAQRDAALAKLDKIQAALDYSEARGWAERTLWLAIWETLDPSMRPGAPTEGEK